MELSVHTQSEDGERASTSNTPQQPPQQPPSDGPTDSRDGAEDVIQSAVGKVHHLKCVCGDAIEVRLRSFPVAPQPTFEESSCLCARPLLQTAALDAARKALENTRARAPSRPDPSRTFTYTATKWAPPGALQIYKVLHFQQFD